MTFPMQTDQFHSYLLKKLLADPIEINPKLIKEILKRTPPYMPILLHRSIETYALFAKLSGPQPFAHMCALAAMLVDQPYMLTSKFQLEHKMGIRIPEAVVSLLYDLGRLVRNFPKLCYLNMTVDEYIERRMAFQMFFSDFQTSYLHEFWRKVDPVPARLWLPKEKSTDITDELREQIKSNIMKIVRKLFKDMMMEQICGPPPLSNAEEKVNENGGPLPAWYVDVRKKTKGTVMLQLVDEDRIHRSTDDSSPPNRPTEPEEKSKKKPTAQGDDNLKLFKHLISQEYWPKLEEVSQDVHVAETEIVEFLLCAMGCYEQNELVKVNEKSE